MSIPPRSSVLAAALLAVPFSTPAVLSAQAIDAARFRLAARAEAPGSLRSATAAHRLDADAGGSVFGIGVFGALRALGREHMPIAPGTDIRVAYGVDTTFTLPANSGAAGAVDSVEVVFPGFRRWGTATHPFDHADELGGIARVGYAHPGGSTIGIRYDGTREQRAVRALDQLYNPDGWLAARAAARTFEAEATIELSPSARDRLSARIEAGRTTTTHESGLPTSAWVAGHGSPAFGFSSENVDFLVESDDWAWDEQLELLLRSGYLPDDTGAVFAGRPERVARQTYPRLNESLRLNPYGVRTGLPISGLPTLDGDAWRSVRDEGDWLEASLEWQRGPWLAMAGADWQRNTVDRASVPFLAGAVILHRTMPTRLGGWLTGRVDIGGASLDGGLRVDRLNAGGIHPRVPGFVWVLPDSLRRDGYEMDPVTGRLTPVADCDDSVVCLDNFIETTPQTALSRHAGATVHVSDGGALRVAYREHVHGPALPDDVWGDAPAPVWSGLVFENAMRDFGAGGLTVANRFGRAVAAPRSRVLEARFRQRLSERAVIDAGAFRQTISDAFTYRRIRHTNPVSGADLSINSLVNHDVDPRMGVDLFIDANLGRVDASFGYTYRDVDVGTTGLVRGLPVAPAGTADPWSGAFGPGSNASLDAARRHTLSAVASLFTPDGTGPLADAGVTASARFASGLPFPRLVSAGAGDIGPPVTGSGGVAERGERHTPWVSWSEVRAHKGVRVGATRVRAFVGWAGPVLGDNQSQVFLETGDVRNAAHRQAVLDQHLADPTLDGDANIDALWVRDCLELTGMCEFSGNAVNAYALIQAEREWGNGDGLFEVAEQERAFGAYYDLFAGPQWLRRSDRAVRLGIELLF